MRNSQLLKQRANSWIKFIKLHKKRVKAFSLWKKIESREGIVELREGSKFLVRPGIPDLQMINEVYLDGTYNRGLQNVSSNGIIIDIGANIGTFTVLAGRLKSKSRIYAYEPFPDNYRVLKKNIELNKLQERAKAFQFGVANKRETRNLFIGKEGNATHSLFNNSGKSVQIKTVSLEDIFKENNLSRCDLLKVDCEGAEYEIFNSVKKNILRKIFAINLEYHSNGNPNTLKKRLKKEGFKVAMHGPDFQGNGFIYAINEKFDGGKKNEKRL